MSSMRVREENIAELPFIFESKDVIRLLGIPSVLLNKFVEKEVCGIKPSIRTGVGKGSRRLFSSSDLYAIALVWWLFKAGFRSQILKELVRMISKGKSANAYTAEMVVSLENSKEGHPF